MAESPTRKRAPAEAKPARPARAKAKKAPAASRADGAPNARDAILSAALTVFAKHGFEGASLLEIANHAGTRHPVILYHFGSKELLWQAVINHIFNFGDLHVNRYRNVDAWTRDLEPLAVLKLVCRSFIHFAANNPERLALVIYELYGGSSRLQWLCETHFGPFYARLGPIIQAAVDDGAIAPIPVPHFAQILIGAASMFYLGRPVMKIIHDVDTTDPATIDAHADWVMQALFNGLETRN